MSLNSSLSDNLATIRLCTNVSQVKRFIEWFNRDQWPALDDAAFCANILKPMLIEPQWEDDEDDACVSALQSVYSAISSRLQPEEFTYLDNGINNIKGKVSFRLIFWLN